MFSISFSIITLKNLRTLSVRTREFIEKSILDIFSYINSIQRDERCKQLTLIFIFAFRHLAYSYTRAHTHIYIYI